MNSTPRRAPGVSLVLTCYNAAWCIERALDSVLSQTLVPEELIVSDDGSTDDTVEHITGRYGDAVTVLRLPHRGLTASRIAAIDAARGPWLALMDADDTWLPDKTERQLDTVERHPELAWVSGDGALVGEQGMIEESWLAGYFEPVRDLVGDLFPHVVQRCFPLVSSSLVRKSAYLAVGGMDPDIEYSQDYALWLRLSARFPAAVMSARLIHYWSSPTQMSRRIEERYRDDKRLMERVARGEYRRDPNAQRVAREKVASYEFDLGVICLRSGRFPAGRRHLWRAASMPGPLHRRALALFGVATPRGALHRLMHSPWLKGTVQRARRSNPMLGREGGS
ncbi:MAG: glycosyltransferase family 2 protein [Candidatus Eisenbacteria bacterium]